MTGSRKVHKQGLELGMPKAQQALYVSTLTTRLWAFGLRCNLSYCLKLKYLNDGFFLYKHTAVHSQDVA